MDDHLGVIGTWLLGKLASGGVSVGISAILRRFFPNNLEMRLDAVADAWRKALPPNAALLDIRAILATSYPSLPDKPAPSPVEVTDKLQAFLTPTPADWLTVLFRQWHWVRSAVGEPQPFFQLEEAIAKAFLRDLAEKLSLECQKDRERFQVQSLQNDTLILGEIQGLRPLLERDRGPSAGLHPQIDTAVEFTKKGQPEIAIAQLEALKRTDWGTMDGRERYRLVANLGHAHDAKEENDDAARCFIECRQYQPADEMARTLEAIGHSMLGDCERARQLADEVLTQFPASDLACATRIRNEPTEKSFDEIEADVPSPLISFTETRFALSWRAMQSGNFVKAEHYARLVLNSEKDSTVAAEHLAVVLLNAVRAEVVKQFVLRPQPERAQPVQEAKALLDAALAKTPQGLRVTHARIRFFIGIACVLLGEDFAADGHFRAAYDANPRNPDYVRHFALLQHDLGRHNAAIDILTGGISSDTAGRTTVLLSAFLLGRDCPGDTSAAIKHVEALLSTAAIDPITRMECVSLLVDAHEKENRHDESSRVLEREKSAISPIDYETIRAKQVRRAGDPDEAATAIRKAFALITDSTDLPTKRMIAEELTIQKQWNEGLAMWRALVQPNCLGSHTRALIECALNAGDDGFLLEFCGALRLNGFVDPDLFHLEVNKLLEYNADTSAIAAIQQYLSKPTDAELARELQLRLSHLALATNRSDLVCFDLAKLPSVEVVEPELGPVTVVLLRKGPRPMDAVEYAYELVRKHFESSHAHKAVVVSILGQSRDQRLLPESDTAKPGFAIQYKDDSTGEARWHVIEDGPNPASTRNEYGPSHGLSIALNGKRVGETFTIRKDQVQEKTGTVIQMWSKYKYRFNLCMEEWETRFPDDHFLWKFSFGHAADGTVDFSPVRRVMERRQAALREWEKSYRDSVLSVTHFAMMSDETVLEAVHRLTSTHDLPVRCCQGTAEEANRAEACFDGSQTVILDGSALATLFVTGLSEQLRVLSISTVVSCGTIFELRERVLESRELGGSPEQDQNIDKLEAFISQVEQAFRIEEGLELARMGHTEREELLQFAGRPAAETIALAKSHGYILWSDDQCISAIAESEAKVPRVWTDFILHWAADARGLTNGAQYIASLAAHNYSFTRLTPEAVLWACAAAGWDADDPRLAPVLRWFASPLTRDTTVFQIVGQVLPRLWREAPSALRADPVIVRILRHISARMMGKRILRALFQRIESFCGLDVVAARQLKLILSLWSK